MRGVQGHLLIGNGLLGVGESRLPVHQIEHVCQCINSPETPIADSVLH